jgi:molecular chaperone HtpG
VTTETHEFKAEVAALLKLVTNSLYANSEVFLRELISNASDALDKARFQAIVQPEIEGQDLDAAITIVADRQANTLTIEDTGIGLTREEAARNLGTIAHSGTLQFLAEMKKQQSETGGKQVDLIGQFGVGFYSAFMVADRVVVHSRSAEPGAEPVRWTSSGDGAFTIEADDRDTRGSRIVLEVAEDNREYLDGFRIRNIVRRYSNYVMHPIRLVTVDEDGTRSDPEQINSAQPLWSRKCNEVEDSDYQEFYKHVMGGFLLPGDEAIGRVHLNVEAPIQFDALLFVPGRAPADLFMEDRKALQLFARRVLVMESNDSLLPTYLRFFRGVVDSEDLPLNVSREMLQEHRSLAAIRRQLTRKALKLLEEIAADEDVDRYGRLWREFGSVIKEGLHVDGSNRDALMGLVRWRTVANDDAWVSLEAYTEAMPDDQDAIYYVAGSDEAALRRSPHLEAIRARGHDVFLMTDAVDEWVLQNVAEYGGKPFKNVAQADAPEASEDDDEVPPSPIDPLLERAREVLGDRVRDVRASARLTESASCLVDAAGGISRNMERILRMARRDADGTPSGTPRILELNPDHAFVRAANERAGGGEEQPLDTWIELLFDLAALAEGDVVDPAGAVRRIQSVLDQVAGG